MRPFLVTEPCRSIVGSYPPQEVLANAAPRMRYQEVLGFLRLWISEGIPFCFRETPMLYETLREWLAGQIGADPNTVTMIGSGRIGYSLSPAPQYGKPFSSQSDLDLSVIAEHIFDRLSADFYRWRADTQEGKAKPQNATERLYWDAIQKELPGNIAMGFLDSHKIPLRREYATAQRIGQALWLLNAKLRITAGAPKTRKVSLRVYSNWPSFLKRLSLNFNHTIKSIKPPIPPTSSASR